MTLFNTKCRTAAWAAVAVAASTTIAAAADLGGYRPYERPEPEPVYAPAAYVPIWQGLYVGANGGYGFGESTYTDPSGFFGGVQAGYNIQRDSLVFGIEADYQLADFNDATAFVIPAGFGAAQSDTDWFSTVRGRVGLAAGPALFYVTGGVAFADIDTTLGLQQGANNAVFNKSDVETGYVVGAGLEWMLASNLSAKIEYLYMDFGDTDLNGIDNLGNAVATSVSNDMQTARFGLNYHF